MKNGILTFICAFCPGAGQMYQGYMKRGLSLITLFCCFAGAGALLNILLVGMPIVWMYSFFDTFNLRAQLGAGNAPADDYLVHVNWKDRRMEQFLMDSHKLVGWGLIALGVLVAYQNIIMNTLADIVWRWGQSNPFFRALYLVMDALPEVVVCVALIVCGVWLVRGPKGRRHRRGKEQQDAGDFSPYEAAGPAEENGDCDFAMPELSALLGQPVTSEDPQQPEQEEQDGTEE